MTLGRPPMDPAIRFWAKVEKTETCWLWTAAKDRDGYGVFQSAGRTSGGRQVRAHRWAYETLVELIPQGMTLDHLCRVRHCVNPEHLEPTTPIENYSRGRQLVVLAKCGHPFNGIETGSRMCKPCRRAKAAAAKRRRVEARTGHKVVPRGPYKVR